MANRIYKAFAEQNIVVSKDVVTSILNGNGTKADGDVTDLIESLAMINRYDLINEIWETI